ncbi:MAG TPA: DUF1634 domain-containing protein [Terriglobales bacterium]|jgi:uncharacterized membrane protein|nr:DUF1634 domain-containing protein [Terriglobales bacterium]
MTDSTQTPAASGTWNDQRIEVIIGTLLRTGVMLAAAVVLFGAVLYLARHGHEPTNYSRFHGEPESLKSPMDIVHGVVDMDARAIIQFGLLLLIATPVARVAFSAIAFAIEHDYMYVVITLIVLVILLFSLFAS